MPEQHYRGDVTPKEAWAELVASKEAVLVDVRTLAEWSFVGVPSLDSIGKTPILIEWQTFPDGQTARDFASALDAEMTARGAGKEAPIFFLCRSGARSQAAAIVATQAGYLNCFNIGFGFEGPLDESRHRNTLDGWRAVGLPWAQT